MPSTLLRLFLILTGLLSACATTPQNIPSPTLTATSDAFFVSNGGGDPRTPSYWLMWNACAENNKSEIAQANGGREAGWIVMDDLLTDPGVLIGTLQLETCQQGVSLLQARNLQGSEMKNDAAYTLAVQLLAAQLNLGTGSEYCPASDQAVSQAQLLLLELSFDGTKGHLGPPLASPDVETARLLTQQLSDYNSGALCR